MRKRWAALLTLGVVVISIIAIAIVTLDKGLNSSPVSIVGLVGFIGVLVGLLVNTLQMMQMMHLLNSHLHEHTKQVAE